MLPPILVRFSIDLIRGTQLRSLRLHFGHRGLGGPVQRYPPTTIQSGSSAAAAAAAAATACAMTVCSSTRRGRMQHAAPHGGHTRHPSPTPRQRVATMRGGRRPCLAAASSSGIFCPACTIRLFFHFSSRKCWMCWIILTTICSLKVNYLSLPKKAYLRYCA